MNDHFISLQLYVLFPRLSFLLLDPGPSTLDDGGDSSENEYVQNNKKGDVE
jgi:hypothetical protein